MPLPVTGAFTGIGQSAAYTPRVSDGLTIERDINISTWGTFVATFQPERSFDGGMTWLPLTALGSAITFSTPCTEVFSEPEDGVQYRLNCTAYTSGTVNYRLSN